VVDEAQRALLDRYVDAFERYDMDSLVALLHEDAVMSMPPYDFWLQGPEEMRRFFLGAGSACRGSRWSPPPPTGAPPSPRTSPTAGAATTPGRSR
jgi:RNA polymerase sigma-70 factor (ECF subfamily)